jgi:transcriptional regulator with XRE-family HTH domain
MSSRKIIERLQSPEYRNSFVDSRMRTLIALQARTLREDRGWSQTELAERMDKQQSAVSRLEDPERGRPSLTTLLEVAAAFDVALLVRFVDHKEFLSQISDLSPDSLRVESYRPFSQAERRLSTTPRLETSRATTASVALRQGQATKAQQASVYQLPIRLNVGRQAA